MDDVNAAEGVEASPAGAVGRVHLAPEPAAGAEATWSLANLLLGALALAIIVGCMIVLLSGVFQLMPG